MHVFWDGVADMLGATACVVSIVQTARFRRHFPALARPCRHRTNDPSLHDSREVDTGQRDPTQFCLAQTRQASDESNETHAAVGGARSKGALIPLGACACQKEKKSVG